METPIFHQRLSYATISLVKNYNTIPLKKESEIKDIFDSLTWNTNEMIEISGGYKKPSAHFFYNKNEGSMEHVAFPSAIKRHYTTKDRQIKRHYNNPFAEIEVHITERKVRKKGDKLSMTLTQYVKRRTYNSKYFRSSTMRTTFTFDLIKGNFTIINSNSASKKQTQTFVTNSFQNLEHILFSGGLFYLEKPQIKKNNENLQKSVAEQLNDKEFFNFIAPYFTYQSNKNISHTTDLRLFYQHLVEIFVKLKKIKIPNDEYQHLLKFYYPTEKFFKKNDRKLIASVLDSMGCKSKMLIKIVHDHRYLDLLALVEFSILFGENYTKYVGNIKNDFFIKSSYKRDGLDAPINIHNIKNRITEFKNGVSVLNFYDDEKENVIRCLDGQTFEKGLTMELVRDLFDHVYMVNKIREVDPSFRIKARTAVDFTKEHQEFSKIISAMKKGWVIEYVFNPKMIDDIEKPITKSFDNGNDKRTYYPHILKREEEYIEEGNFMHHCVASYADHERSIIISLRTEDKSNRVTSEFNIQDGRCVQSRHFCNGSVPLEFIDVLEDLKDKVILNAKWGLLNWTEKKKVPLKINGIEVTQKVVRPDAVHNLPF